MICEHVWDFDRNLGLWYAGQHKHDYHPTVLPLNQYISEQTDEKSCLESQNNVGNVVVKNRKKVIHGQKYESMQ